MKFSETETFSIAVHCKSSNGTFLGHYVFKLEKIYPESAYDEAFITNGKLYCLNNSLDRQLKENQYIELKNKEQIASLLKDLQSEKMFCDPLKVEVANLEKEFIGQNAIFNKLQNYNLDLAIVQQNDNMSVLTGIVENLSALDLE